ncbi:hypothetical protein [Acinetobacter sp. ANC 4178]|uniref:hypothetical protein n=1 Tax=Acinetobacter sp. ANC 4178 TaxID=2529839 RepID=UPI00103AF5D9|nr:hypothetical protein [Acinetobacter sp. ANC 4178]TCB68844.1 hypothetical protein E0H87_02580 [Acinetobacter sp. ANC 4178]
MNLPWLKSLIFWIIVIVVIFAAFQCTQKSENNKSASALMYERLYQCSRDLSGKNALVLKSIQKQIRADMKQQELMQLITTCRQANPLKTQVAYTEAIQRIK